jgi:hypothetical protein
MICTWVQFDPQLGNLCGVCGRWWKVNSPPDRARRACTAGVPVSVQLPKVNLRDCIHRGPKVDERPCETCKGNVRVFIFECAALGKCTEEKKFADLASCRGCSRFTALPK